MKLKLTYMEQSPWEINKQYAKVDKKLSDFYWTRKFNAVFTTASQTYSVHNSKTPFP